jgi:hypothetical protein
LGYVLLLNEAVQSLFKKLLVGLDILEFEKHRGRHFHCVRQSDDQLERWHFLPSFESAKVLGTDVHSFSELSNPEFACPSSHSKKLAK